MKESNYLSASEMANSGAKKELEGYSSAFAARDELKQLQQLQQAKKDIKLLRAENERLQQVIAAREHALRRVAYYLEWAAIHHVTAKSVKDMLHSEARVAWPDLEQGQNADTKPSPGTHPNCAEPCPMCECGAKRASLLPRPELLNALRDLHDAIMEIAKKAEAAIARGGLWR